MKFFLDTADVNAIKEAAACGLLDGVTTNPSLVAKANRSYRSIIEEICEICKGPISAEVIATETDGMMTEARSYAQIGPQVVVKIPLTMNGLRAVSMCAKEGIKTNVTLCFGALQALAAAKSGATYISPFIGRLDDIGSHGMKLISEIKTIYQNYKISTEILVASVRSTQHALEAAMLGADCVTLPPKIFHEMVSHPLTDKGLAIFLADAAKIPV